MDKTAQDPLSEAAAGRRRPLLLASTSRYRKGVLGRLGIPFEAADPAVDEAPFHAAGDPPRQLALKLAEAKAAAGARLRPGALAIGGDQVLAFEGAVLHKPGGEAAAAAQLARLAGRTHTLFTAVAVALEEGGAVRAESACAVATLDMRPLTPEAIGRYLAADRPFDCCGSYRFEALGAALFEAVDADDPTAIEGLPLLALVRLLAGFGVELP